MLPVITLSAIDRGASISIAALIGALLGIGSIVTNIPSGILATRIGERKSMLMAAIATAATSIDLRSPIRVARIPEGMFVTIEPMPRSAPMRAAIEGLAPRSMALSAMTGSIDPWARPNRVAGP